ncbi:putative outer membrane lipoprotein [Vibrio ishigakensis]|uniref:Putative outer membrane lipoprotein n=1 Tax=Vibrio ishigakensis TaxID=1481914 RepID=A0A0B8P1Y9_9VIBR|nr:putative outer membrane lipoprotein [Vibrio ishigakensis]
MKTKILLLAIATALAGCASALPEKDELALLNGNHKYQELDYKSDEQGLYWKSDDYKTDEYQNVIVDDVKIELSQSIKDKVSPEVIARFEAEIKASLTEKSNKLFPHDATSQKQAMVDVHIIKVEDLEEDIRALEFIPVGAAIGLAKLAAGTRDRSVRLIVDVDVNDKADGHLLARRVFAINNNGVLENDHSKITSKVLDKDVEKITQQGAEFILHTLYM